MMDTQPEYDPYACTRCCARYPWDADDSNLCLRCERADRREDGE